MRISLRGLTILVSILCILAVVGAGCANRMILPSDDNAVSSSDAEPSPSPSPSPSSVLPAQADIPETESPVPSASPSPSPTSSADETFEEESSVTVPADYLEKIPLEQVLRAATFLGVKDYTENEDGSVTFQIDPSLREKIADTYGDSIRSFLSGLGGSDDFPGLTVCSLNAEMDTLSLTIDEEIFDLSQSQKLGDLLYTPLCIYRLLEGKSSGEFELNVVVQNEKGVVIDTIVCDE